jgi:hypothetical protein
LWVVAVLIIHAFQLALTGISSFLFKRHEKIALDEGLAGDNERLGGVQGIFPGCSDDDFRPCLRLIATLSNQRRDENAIPFCGVTECDFALLTSL